MNADGGSIWTKIVAALGAVVIGALIILDVLGAAREVGGL